MIKLKEVDQNGANSTFTVIENQGFKCISGCGECCGCVPLPPEIITKHIQKLQRPVIEILDVQDTDKGVIALTPDRHCIFLSKERRCLIYLDRPKVCRVFGLTPTIPCWYIKPDGRKRSRHDTVRMLRHNRKVSAKDMLNNIREHIQERDIQEA